MSVDMDWKVFHANIKKCPKCKASSGDDWKQCRGSCPVPHSPHYDSNAKGAPHDMNHHGAYLKSIEKPLLHCANCNCWVLHNPCPGCLGPTVAK